MSLIPRLFVVASLLVAATPTPGLAAGGPRDLADIKTTHELRIAADPTAGAPYFSTGTQGPVGFEADFGAALARKLGVKPIFVTVPWRELERSLGDGRADVALNALEVREVPNVRFTKPYYIASQAILIRADQAGIYDLQDLKGKRVATTTGSVAQAILGQLKPPAIPVLSGHADGPFKALADRSAQAVLLEAAMVRTWLKKDPKRFKLTGRPVLPRPYAAAVRRGSPKLLAALDVALADLRKSGEHARILQRYGLWDSLQAGAGAMPTASPAPTPTPEPRRRRRHHR